jgi:parallel beta-helix repeat protein
MYARYGVIEEVSTSVMCLIQLLDVLGERLLKRIFSTLMLTVFAVSILVFSYKIQTVKAGTVTVPDDYSTIQEAINNANTGDTIFVRNGTYYENIVVNKTVSLIGENRNTTIVDGNLTGDVFTINASNVIISNFKTNGGTGFIIYGNNVTVSDCFMTYSGIYVHGSESKIIGNLIDHVRGPAIYLYYSNNNTIVGNTISNAWAITRSGTTFVAWYSSYSRIFHNNFINCWWYWRGGYFASPNWWDNGCEGNYWDCIVGNDTNGDGVLDEIYDVGMDRLLDYYPLANPYWSPADVNHDLKVDILDAVNVASSYGATPSSSNWNQHVDIAQPYGNINILDLTLCCSHYAEKYH